MRCLPITSPTTFGGDRPQQVLERVGTVLCMEREARFLYGHEVENHEPTGYVGMEYTRVY